MQRDASKLTLEEVISTPTRERVMIRPSVVVKATNAAERQTIVEAVRRVIAEHRDVLVALRDR